MILTISIIVPVYKVERYLRQCLDSVLAQTFTDYECILVDDGSPDNCPAICDEYAGKDTRFKVIHKENGGLSDARNVGIRAATGNYIVLLDSDDLFASDNALVNLVKIIKETEGKVICNVNLTVLNDTDYSITYTRFDLKKKIYTPISFYKEIKYKRKIPSAGCLFSVKRDFLLQHNLLFKEGLLHEDEHWVPRIICLADGVAMNYDRFYVYRQNVSTSITANRTSKNLYNMLLILNDFIKYSKSETYSIKNRNIFVWQAAQLWCGIFSQLPGLYIKNKKDYCEISYELNQLKFLLFRGRSVKYILFALAIVLIGIDRLVILQVALKKTKNKLKQSHV